MNFCANDLKSITVRVLHVASNYYEARRLHGRLGGFTGSEIHINISLGGFTGCSEYMYRCAPDCTWTLSREVHVLF